MTLSRGMLPTGDQAVPHRMDHLADDLDLVGLEHEGIERRVDRSLDGVLDRDYRALRGPVLDSHHAVVDRRQRNGLESWSLGPASEAIRASSLNVPSGPRNATRTCAAPGCCLGGGRRRGSLLCSAGGATQCAPDRLGLLR